MFIEEFSKLNLPFHGVICPKIKLEKKDRSKYGISEEATNLEILQALCNKGFKAMLPKWKNEKAKIEDYKDRVRLEVETLNKLNFVDYILIVWDVFNFCKKNDIPTGLGRGSAAGSLVLYLLGVTGVDPVKYGLFFQRFVSEARAKQQVIDGVTYLDGKMIADIDSDICYYRRKEVMKYLEEKYPERTSKMLTVSTLSGKALIKDCGKIIGEKDETEMNKITALFTSKYGKVAEPEEMYETSEDFKNWCDENETVYKTALKLKNLIRNKGVHASGILVSHDKLIKTTPTELTSDKEIVSSFTMDWATKINIKLDLLGLKSVSVIHEVSKITGLDYKKIDLEDYETIYAHLQDLKHPKGLFQIEADVNYKVCQKVKPRNLDQLSAVVALARPGALDYADQYATYALTGVKPEIDPIIESILENTGNICLYQEQVMAMFNKIGFSLTDSEEIRRAIGKKLPEEVAKWKPKIYEQCESQGIKKETADQIWKVCEDSANYQFNFSHSLCYSAMSALTTYFKFNHPKEFFLALLKMAKNEQDSLSEINTISQEMRHFGITLLPPDLAKSGEDFEIEGNNIRYGLSAIKGISKKVIEKMINFRGNYSSKIDLFIAAKQAKISIGVLSALIQAGALESVNTKSRSRLVLEAQTWNILKDKEKILVRQLIEEGKYSDILLCVKALSENIKDDKGKPIIKESRFKTIKRDYDKFKTIYLLNSRNEELANFFYEKELLGMSYSESLSQIYSKKNENIKRIEDINNLTDKQTGLFVGIVNEILKRTSRNGNPYVKYTVGDESGSIECFLFSSARRDKVAECKEFNGGKLPEEGDIVVVKGTKKDGNACYIEKLGIQSAKIYMALRDIKDIDLIEEE
jgi:DNA polymerase III subunit alpha